MQFYLFFCWGGSGLKLVHPAHPANEVGTVWTHIPFDLCFRHPSLKLYPSAALAEPRSSCRPFESRSSGCPPAALGDLDELLCCSQFTGRSSSDRVRLLSSLFRRLSIQCLLHFGTFRSPSWPYLSPLSSLLSLTRRKTSTHHRTYFSGSHTLPIICRVGFFKIKILILLVLRALQLPLPPSSVHTSFLSLPCLFCFFLFLDGPNFFRKPRNMLIPTWPSSSSGAKCRSRLAFNLCWTSAGVN